MSAEDISVSLEVLADCSPIPKYAYCPTNEPQTSRSRPRTLARSVIPHPPADGAASSSNNVPGSKLLYGSGWDAVHPFDRIHGTHTSGFVSADQLPAQEAARAHAVFYAGSQPSVLREGLKALPPLQTCTFVDLGCGKGRPLLVASEFPFWDILGVELSPDLAKVAERNAAIIAERFPDRTPIRIAVGDASNFPIPSGDVVLFLYNPFGAELIAKVVQRVEAALRTEPRSIWQQSIAIIPLPRTALTHPHFSPAASRARFLTPKRSLAMGRMSRTL